MKRVLMTVLVAASLNLSLPTAQADEAYDLLVGTYTAGSSEGIYRYRFDARTGQIAARPAQILVAENPSWLTLSKDQRRLFVVNENGPGQKDSVGRVSSYTVAAGSHQIAPVNQVPSEGDEPTHSSLSADERFLFVSNYAVAPDPGGSLSVLAVSTDGTLSSVVQQHRHQASKVNPERQAGPHVHSTVVGPDGRFVFVSDLGADKVFIYRYDGDNAKAPLSPASPRSVSLPPGSGPRHLVFDKAGKHAYLTLEMTAQVVVFDYHGGKLTLKQQLDLASKSGPVQGAGGALHLSPDGKFLYVSNRGTVNEMVVFAVDDKSGQLKRLQNRSVEGDHPREFTLDPTGKFLLIADQKSNAVVVVQRDTHTGLLGKKVQSMNIDAPSDLKFLANHQGNQ